MVDYSNVDQDPCSDNPVQHGVEHPLGVQGEPLLLVYDDDLLVHGDDTKARNDQ